MMSIGEVIGQSERLVELKEQAATRAAQAETEWESYAAANGWSVGAECRACGDTGHRPDWNRLCERCDVATRLQRQRDRVESWHRTVPPRFRDYRLDSSPCPEAADAVRLWLAAGGWTRGENLMLSGPVGAGKTGLLVSAVYMLWDAGASPRFVGVPAMLDGMRPGGSDEDPMDRLVAASVLALDDLGAEKPSDWVRERLYVLVNGRYEARRSTIVTTNCNLGELAVTIGERTVSRLQEEATIIAVAGEDQRR
jgi:DNA replication protein DnaC